MNQDVFIIVESCLLISAVVAIKLLLFSRVLSGLRGCVFVCVRIFLFVSSVSVPVVEVFIVFVCGVFYIGGLRIDE